MKRQREADVMALLEFHETVGQLADEDGTLDDVLAAHEAATEAAKRLRRTWATTLAGKASPPADPLVLPSVLL